MEKFYALKLKNEKIRFKSASGGAFVSISNYILKKKGVIYAAMYSYEHKELQMTRADSKEVRDLMCGSMYLQGHIDKTVLDLMIKDIKEERTCLIVALPCQIGAIQKYLNFLKIKMEKVIFCDLICHGAPSPEFWKKYSTYLELQYGGNIEYVTFKNKRKGWLSPTAFCEINGNEISLEPYMRLFYENVLFRESCYRCSYATDRRKSDITIGDYWNVKKGDPEFYSPIGVSTIITHSEKGDSLIKILMDAELIKCDRKLAMQPNLIAPTPKPIYFKLFWKDANNLGLDELIRKYTSMELPFRIRRKLFISICKFKQNNIKEENFENKIICDTDECIGCGICSCVCPVQAIKMKAIYHGFFYPIIDENICIHCNRCRKVCSKRMN